MANKDAPFGFKPWGPVLRANLYAVPTAPTINICVGDAVMEDLTDVISAKLGLGHAVYDAAVPTTTEGDTRQYLGVVLAVFDEKLDPVQYLAPAEAGDATTAGYVLVADHPDQLFVAQMDGALTAANIGYHYEITSVALCAPNSRTGLSTQEVASAGANVTATIPLKILSQAYPDEDSYAAAGCRVVVQFNPDCHMFGSGTAI